MAFGLYCVLIDSCILTLVRHTALRSAWYLLRVNVKCLNVLFGGIMESLKTVPSLLGNLRELK